MKQKYLDVKVVNSLGNQITKCHLLDLKKTIVVELILLNLSLDKFTCKCFTIQKGF